MKKTVFALFAAMLLLLMPQGTTAQRQTEPLPLPKSIAPMMNADAAVNIAAGPVLKQVPLYESAESGITLIGAVLYHPSFSSNANYNFYTIPTVDSEEIQLTKWSKSTGGIMPNGGGIFSSDMSEFEYIQYANYGTTVMMYYYKYDTNTWEITDGHSVKNQLLLAYDMTRDPVTGNAYGVFISANGRELGIPNYAEQIRSTIGKLSANLLTLSADANGQLFGVASDGNLYKVSKDDASLTLVGSTGVVPADVQQSSVIEPKSGRMFWVGITTDQKSALYEINTATGQASVVYPFSGLIQIVCLNIKPSDIPAGAPAAVSNLKARFEGSSLEGKLSFTMPSETFDGSDLQGKLTYHVLINGVEDFSGEANAGEDVEEDIEVTGGQTTIHVFVSNAEGNGPRGEGISFWAGDDVPVAPANVVLTAVDDQTLTLTWEEPTKGINNGYMNPADLRYDIVRYPDSVLVARDLQGSSFTDKVSPKHLTPYSYDLIAKGKFGQGETARSNIVKVGAPFTTPFIARFDDRYDFDLFTVYDQNGDGTTWHYYPYSARYRFDKTNDANDLMVSPPVTLGTERLYNLSFRYRTMGNPELMRVTFGKSSDDPGQYVTELMPLTTLTNRNNIVVTQRMRVSEAGEYSMAFLVKSTTDGFHLFIDDVAVTDGPMLSAPDSVTSLTTVAAPKGELTTTITFTTPQLTVIGEPLAAISKIEVMRGEKLIKTIETPAVGKQLQLTDNAPDNGINTYTVIAYDAQGNPGLEATSKVYVGKDVPDAPTNVRIAEGDDGKITITWDAPVVGVNGGYVNPDELTYDIMRVLAGKQTVVDSYLDNEPYVDEVDQTGNQNVLYYGVCARNSMGESDYQQSNSLVAGKPFDFPFCESFPNGVMSHPFLSSNHSDQLNWPVESADGDNGSISFIKNNYDYLYIETGKISLEGAVRPGLVYSLYEQPGQGKLYVQVSANTGERITLETVDFSQVSGEAKWASHTVMLDQFKDKKYVRVRFLFENDRQSVYMLDNINVRDVLPVNMALTQLAVPAKASAGVDTPVQVCVANAGSEAAANVSLNLYVNGELQQSASMGTVALNAEVQQMLTARFNAGQEGQATIRVEVTADGDQQESDNMKEATLQVVVEQYPLVANLQGTIDDQKKVSLSWTAPSLEGFAPTWTDDVEGYQAYIIDDIGDWTVYDGDGAPSYTIPNSQLQFPNLGTEFAVMVLNPYTVFRRDPGNPYTHSGDQCFAFFDAQAQKATETNGRSDDWLISPRLSELKQTVTFWARSMTTTDYAEDFEVLYSTGGNLVSDFRGNVVLKVEKASAVWTEYKAELPAGAKYFAIHMNSFDQFALLVDDITFQPEIPGGKIEIAGYNVYRDGSKIAATDAATTQYSETMEGEGAVYQVSVVYKTAESPLSQKLGFGTEGIADAMSDRRAGHAVYDLQGRKVQQGAAMSKGIYIMQGRKVVK